MYSLHQQYLDLASGFHVIELRDERGHQHLVQLAVGHDACPACGAVHPKDNLDTPGPGRRRPANQRGTEYVTTADAYLRRQARARGEMKRLGLCEPPQSLVANHGLTAI